MYLRLSILLVCIAMVAACNPCECDAQAITRVIDGDTYVMDDGRTIRLQSVDCWELKQPGGTGARDFAKLMLEGRRVRIVNVRSAAYGRFSARVLWNNWDVGATMLARGHGMLDKRYCYSKDICDKYADIQAKAKAASKGAWQLKDTPAAPWDFRKGSRNFLLPELPEAAVKHSATPVMPKLPTSNQGTSRRVYIRQPVVFSGADCVGNV